jgi:hypothetical protein
MTTHSRWFTRMLYTVVPALAVAGIASVASAQGPVCVHLDRGVPPGDLLRLVTTSASSGFISVVGERAPVPPFGVRGVLSGGGVVTGGVLDIGLHETGIGNIVLPAGPTSFLLNSAVHIRLDTATLAGTFKAFEVEVTSVGNTATEHFEGTAAVVTCPPAG